MEQKQKRATRIDEHRPGTRLHSRFTSHEYIVAENGSWRRIGKPLSKRARRRLAAARLRALGRA